MFFFYFQTFKSKTFRIEREGRFLRMVSNNKLCLVEAMLLQNITTQTELKFSKLQKKKKDLLY